MALARRSILLAVAAGVLAGCSLFGGGPADDPYGPDNPLFVRVEESGLPTTGQTWGGTFADLDHDGLIDLVYSPHANEIRAYRNLGGLKFERIDESWTVPEGLRDPHGVCAYDFDGDSDTDFYVSVGAERGRGKGSNQFWVCEGPGLYRDLAAEQTVLQDRNGRGRGLGWIALGPDAETMLIVGNYQGAAALFGRGEQGWEDWKSRVHPAPDQTRPHGWWMMSSGDLDLDGHTDLVAARQTNLLYRNDGQGNLVDVSRSVGIALSGTSFSGVPLGDLDGDGDLDLLVALRGRPWLTGWMNELGEDGWSFRKTHPGEELDIEHLVFGSYLADLDSDGRLDLYLLRGRGRGKDAPNLVARGRGDGTFDDRSAFWGGVDSTTSLPHSAWPVDLDADGDLDLMCFQRTTEATADGPPFILYENRAPATGISLRFTSTAGPPEGLGAVVEVLDGKTWRRREVRFRGDPFSSMVAPVHFGGLDPDEEPLVRVRWRSGPAERFRLPAVGAAYVLTQGEGIPDTPEVAAGHPVP